MSAGRVLLAPDSFKGTLSAAQVAEAMAAGLAGLVEVDRCPAADGGEGTAAALAEALGGDWVWAEASDPLGRRREAPLLMLDHGQTAVVEVAAASGLTLIARSERDAWRATSRGTGELIAAAIDRGARRVLIACGGSASTDGGAGALEAFDPGTAELVVLCDTAEPFEQAAPVFAPQKGADPGTVARLSERARAQAAALPRNPAGVEMTGAAGGLAGGLWAHGARLVRGAPYVLRAVGFDRRLRAATACLTGEGRLDRTSLSGKLVGEVAVRARQAGVPCHAIVGEDALDAFSARILDLASVREAGQAAAIAAAARHALGGGP